MHLADRCFPALMAEPRFVEALLIPFHDHGRPVGTVWIVAHNDERKFDGEDERILRTLASFASAGWQLWKAYESAAESSRLKGDFVAMLGHEFRNPLAAILSASDMLHKIGSDDPGHKRASDVVTRQAKHLCRMVDDLTDLSRISRGRLDLQKEPVEIGTLVARALEMTRAQIERHGHHLSVQMPTDPIWVEGDPGRLAQMLSNLLDNAAKYTPKGGEISIVVESVAHQACIRVRDNGIGILKHQIDHLRSLCATGRAGDDRLRLPRPRPWVGAGTKSGGPAWGHDRSPQRRIRQGQSVHGLPADHPQAGVAREHDGND
jgi:signal transduction histidine kinase